MMSAMGLGIGERGQMSQRYATCFWSSFLPSLRCFSKLAQGQSLPTPPLTFQRECRLWLPYLQHHPSTHTQPSDSGLGGTGSPENWPPRQVLCLLRPPSRTAMI